MPHLLHLDASLDQQHSRSRSITAAFSDTWEAQGDDFTVTYRDLHLDPVPHLRDPALHWPARLRQAGSPTDPAEERIQQGLIEQLLSADVLLLGVPMYNYSLPSTLKAWIDHIHVPGLTAPFDGDTQPMAGRPAVLVTARGGSYDEGSPTEGWDHTIPPLQLILGTALGMRVHVIATSLTLADSVPRMAEHLDRARAEAEKARADAVDLALTLSKEPRTS
jgi:FMN-dependent NADH-azoreductase